MIQGEGWYMIRELQREGLSISEIAREAGRDRKTIRKIRDAPGHPPPQVRRKRGSKLDPYKAGSKRAATAGVLNAVKLLPVVRRHGYPGGVTLIREFLHPLRPAVPVVTERFETEPGQQAQVDWAACGRIWYRGRLRSLSSFTMTLDYSRRQYLGFTVSEDMETFQRCHIDAFRYFCGVPSEILYDNLKTAVDHGGPDGQVVWNKRFRDFADYYGFVPRACQPYRWRRLRHGWLGLSQTPERIAVAGSALAEERYPLRPRQRVRVIGRFPGESSCLSLCWAVLDLVIAGARGLGLSDLDRRELQRLRLERQNDHARTALTA